MFFSVFFFYFYNVIIIVLSSGEEKIGDLETIRKSFIFIINYERQTILLQYPLSIFFIFITNKKKKQCRNTES